MMRDYYGAVIRSIRFGPRRELTLQFEISDLKHNTATDGSDARQVIVRFGGIANYEEVSEFFKDSKSANESLHYLKDTAESKASRRSIEIEFDRTEQRVRIIAAHVDELIDDERPVADPKAARSPDRT